MEFDLDHTAAFYDRSAPGYDRGYAEAGPCYPANLYRLKLVEEVIAGLPPGRALDAGCGTGKLLLLLLRKGWDCAGTDLSAGMLREAERNLAPLGGKKAPLFQTPLDDLSMFADASFDHVFCLGVLPYIPEEKEPGCYRELRRVIKPGGLFVTAHENEIFDAFTFNKYTLRFFERNFYPLLRELDQKSDPERLKSELGSLVTHPDKPVNQDPAKTGRDFIFTKPENPLTYPEKLARYGFFGKENLYYHFHALPPLLREGSPALIELSRRMEVRCARTWQGMFLASTFVSVAHAV